MHHYSTQKCFTLAEVLLTLGIIGVVAAMTIPTLIFNTNSAKYRSQFKKAISTLGQAGLMAQAHSEINYSTNSNSAEACSVNANPDSGDYTFCAIFNTALKGHSIYETLPESASGYSVPQIPFQIENPMYLAMADGTLVIFDSHASGCAKAIGGDITDLPDSCHAYIDVNGTTKPNKVVSCYGEMTESSGVAGSRGVSQGVVRESTVTIDSGTCDVPNDANHMTDIYPVVFHDSIVEPATRASRTILTTSK